VQVQPEPLDAGSHPLQHGTEPAVGYFLLGAILTIGVVYWLITRAEVQRGPHGE